MTTDGNDPVAAKTAQTSSGQNTSARFMERDYWNQRYAAKEFVWMVAANRSLAAEVANLKPGRALDLAAGECRNAVWLAEQGWSVTAVDFSDVAIEKGRQLATERNVADKIDFQVPLAELAPVIGRAARAVVPDGTFLLVAHDSANYKHGYGGPRDPALLYTAEQALAALGGALDIEKAGLVERPVETDSGVMVAIDCLVRGRRR